MGPLVGGLVFSALSLGVAIAAAAAFFSVSSVFLPVLVAVFGFPALMAGGMAAGAHGWWGRGRGPWQSLPGSRLQLCIHPEPALAASLRSPAGQVPACTHLPQHPPARHPAGVFATIAGGALLLPSLIQLVLVGGGLWLGASVAQRLFFAGGGGGEGGVNIGPNGTIDVEAETVDDRDWRDEVFRWALERPGRPGRAGRAGGPRHFGAGQGPG